MLSFEVWLHRVENSRFGARYQVDPQICCVHHSPLLPQHSDKAVRDMEPDASRLDDVRMSESGKQVSTCFS